MKQHVDDLLIALLCALAMVMGLALWTFVPGV